eukprot:scaffold167679_cov19-Tisochrysis_lutea.AAC.1
MKQSTRQGGRRSATAAYAKLLTKYKTRICSESDFYGYGSDRQQASTIVPPFMLMEHQKGFQPQAGRCAL